MSESISDFIMSLCNKPNNVPGLPVNDTEKHIFTILLPLCGKKTVLALQMRGFYLSKNTTGHNSIILRSVDAIYRLNEIKTSHKYYNSDRAKLIRQGKIKQKLLCKILNESDPVRREAVIKDVVEPIFQENTT